MLLNLSTTPLNWHVRVSTSSSWSSCNHVSIQILIWVLTILALIWEVLGVLPRILWVIIDLVEIILWKIFVFLLSICMYLCTLGIDRGSSSDCALTLVKLLPVASSALWIVVGLTLGHSDSAGSCWWSLGGSIVHKSICFRLSSFDCCWLVVVLQILVICFCRLLVELMVWTLVWRRFFFLKSGCQVTVTFASCCFILSIIKISSTSNCSRSSCLSMFPCVKFCVMIKKTTC